MRLIQLHALHLQVLHTLAVVRLRSLGRYPLETMDGLEIHSTDVGGPRIADAPPLAFHQPYNRVFGQLTADQQGALPFGELPVACRAAQPFDMLACTGPGPMRNIAFTRLVEPRTSWIWT